MKRLTEEQAELSPNRLSMRTSFVSPKSSRFAHYDKDRLWDDWYVDGDHHRIKLSWVFRYLSNAVGKSYDKVYSKFTKKLKESRIYSKEPFFSETLDYFKNAFKRIYWFHGEHIEFSVDDNGCIRKKFTPTRWSKKARREKIEYQDYRTYIRKDLDPYMANKFISYFGYPIYLQGITMGFSSKEYDDIFEYHGQMYCPPKVDRKKRFERDVKNHWKETGDERYSKYDYNMTPFKDVFYSEGINLITPPTKAEYAKGCYETIDRLRKQRREQKRERDERDAFALWKYCSIDNAHKKVRKMANKEALKKEKEENIVTIDRLGFDETSFMTPQKFNKDL